MRISKWHDAPRGKRHAKGGRASSEVHYIAIDGRAYELLCIEARARRITVDRLLDDAINYLLDREARA
jgi:hypothetical protein